MNRRFIGILILALVGLTLAATVAQAQSGGPAISWAVIAAGGAASSGGGVSLNDTAVSLSDTGVLLNDTVGQPVIGPGSGGSVGLAAGYWVGCAAAAAGAPDVTATRNGDDIVLTWPAVPADARYQVWVSTTPYFDPDHPGGVTPVIVTGTTYTDTGAAASPVNHFYVVRGLNACGAASANSRRTGKFTYGLTPGMQ